MQLLVALEVARGKEEGTLEYCRVLHASWFVIILWTKFSYFLEQAQVSRGQPTILKTLINDYSWRVQ